MFCSAKVTRFMQNASEAIECLRKKCEPTKKNSLGWTTFSQRLFSSDLRYLLLFLNCLNRLYIYLQVKLLAKLAITFMVAWDYILCFFIITIALY